MPATFAGAAYPNRVAKSPPPTVRLLRPAVSDTPGVLAITAARKTVFYVFMEIPCDIGGRGFALHRLGLGTLYHLRLGRNEDCSCECLGFLAHGHCKHVRALLALLNRGLI